MSGTMSETMPETMSEPTSKLMSMKLQRVMLVHGLLVILLAMFAGFVLMLDLIGGW